MDQNKFYSVCVIHTENKRKKKEHKFLFEFQRKSNNGDFYILIKKRPPYEKLEKVRIEDLRGFEFIDKQNQSAKTKTEAKKVAEDWAMRFCRFLDFDFLFEAPLIIKKTENDQIQAEDGKIKLIVHVDY